MVFVASFPLSFFLLLFFLQSSFTFAFLSSSISLSLSPPRQNQNQNQIHRDRHLKEATFYRKYGTYSNSFSRPYPRIQENSRNSPSTGFYVTLGVGESDLQTGSGRKEKIHEPKKKIHSKDNRASSKRFNFQLYSILKNNENDSNNNSNDNDKKNKELEREKTTKEEEEEEEEGRPEEVGGAMNSFFQTTSSILQFEDEKDRNIVIALGSSFLSICFFFYQQLNPVEELTLMRKMQNESPSIYTVLDNGKPTLIDFYAEWCENCKEMMPVLRELEQKYKGKVNFVMINGDKSENSEFVELFRVDGIPHLALMTKDGEVKTALIGKVPKKVLEDDLDTLITMSKIENGKEKNYRSEEEMTLPYEGYDAFEEESHYPFRNNENNQ